MNLYEIIRPFLFRFDAESVHNFLIDNFSYLGDIFFCENSLNKRDDFFETELLGIKIKNPIGLAGGFDKNASCVKLEFLIGFGFIEVGTVTPRPQKGNPKPRIFRLVQDNALINRLGFNNKGVHCVKKNLLLLKKYNLPIGINIGINRTTSIENAFDDYAFCMKFLYDLGTYFTINISSPNTPELRRLHSAEFFSRLIDDIDSLRKQLHFERPIFVKISPDLIEEELEVIVDALSKRENFGIISTNTTLDRKNLKSRLKNEEGGLSGLPLLEKSNEQIRKINKLSRGRIKIIGVGGIFTAQDVIEKIRCGASAVQLFTSLIYNGPYVVKKILNDLKKILTTNKFSSFKEFVSHTHEKIADVP